MNTIEWIVFIGGLTAIAWVNWYFFMAQAMPDKPIQIPAETGKSSTR
ncbi:hypothetical protein ACTRXD_18365 [Nitrospira sp. T9]